MTANPDTLQTLRRQIAAILDGHGQPIAGTALTLAVADWLQQYNPPNTNALERDEMRIKILMRLLKGVAENIGLGIETSWSDNDDNPFPQIRQ